MSKEGTAKKANKNNHNIKIKKENNKYNKTKKQ